MTVTIHPDAGQSLPDLTRELLDIAGNRGQVQVVTGSRSGVRVSDEVAHAYLSARLGIVASGVVHADPDASAYEALPPVVDNDGERSADFVGEHGPGLVIAEGLAALGLGPTAAELATPTADTPPLTVNPEQKRRPGRPRKTAQPDKPAEPTDTSKEG